MIDSSLLQDFITETTEHLEEMENNLLLLEKSPQNFDLINSIFRCVHTIKGSAEYLGMQKIANLSHDLESLMDNIRNSKVAINLEIVECLISSGDVLSQLVDDLVNEGKERTSIAVPLERISSLLESGSSAEPPDDSKNEPDFTQALKEEEYDEELYVIFVQNLREGLTDCNRIFSRVKSGKTSATVLDECLGLIGSLEALSLIHI